MPKLHIFNPEHDLALASGLSNFTSPHAGRQLRHDLGYLPAVWAAKNDFVLVDNADDARTAYGRLMHREFGGFVEKRELAKLDIDAVEPWGWDAALKSFLVRYGVDVKWLPTDMQLDDIRELSHRKYAAKLLDALTVKSPRKEQLTGVSCCEDAIPAIKQFLNDHQHIVVKAPWSSSGRGIRFIDNMMNDYQERWIRNVIQRQGSVVMEPYYNKVKDFGMEFDSDGQGRSTYLGLSLFHTSNGAYTGNLIASEEDKEEMISRYIPVDLLKNVQTMIEQLTGAMFQGKYHGPFGVDMMIVRGENADGMLFLHPCVEINLRRTMGHVALAMQHSEHLPHHYQQVMQIEYTDNHYKLKIRKL